MLLSMADQKLLSFGVSVMATVPRKFSVNMIVSTCRRLPHTFYKGTKIKWLSSRLQVHYIKSFFYIGL